MRSISSIPLVVFLVFASIIYYVFILAIAVEFYLTKENCEPCKY